MMLTTLFRIVAQTPYPLFTIPAMITFRLGLRQARHKATTPLLRFRRLVKTSTVDWKPVKANPGNLSTLEHQAKTPILRRFLLALMVAMPVISFGLGCWQVKRLQWKADLIAKCENNLAAAQMEEIPAVIDPAIIPEFDYRRFKCKGRFDYDQEMFLGPRMRDGQVGYLVVTPFIREKGKPILVERGWISKDRVVPLTRNRGYLAHLAMPQGEIEIEALFRQMPTRLKLQFEHEPGSRLFNVHDIPAMAEQLGALPIYCQMIYDMHDHPEYKSPEDVASTTNTKEKSGGSGVLGRLWLKLSPATSSNKADSQFISAHGDDNTMVYQEFEYVKSGVPIAQHPKLKFSNNHLQYLITWFGLSVALAGLLIWSFIKKQRYSLADKMLEHKRKLF